MSDDGARRPPQVFDIDDPRLKAAAPSDAAGTQLTVPAPSAGLPPGRSGGARIPTSADFRHGLNWGLWLISSAFALLLMAALLNFWTFVWGLFQRQDWIGWVALALAGVVLLSAAALLAREITGLFRLARIQRLQRLTEAACAGGTPAQGRKALAEVMALYAGRPELNWARAELTEHDRAIMTAPERLALFDRVLMATIDDQAVTAIAQSARRVSVVTAITPFAVLDMGFVLYENLRMLRRIATIYGGRPGYAALFRLAGRVIGHVVATGGLAMTDDLFGQFIGQGLAKRLSARAGQGMFNGGLTARLGIAAIEFSRPMPFIEAKKPRFRDLALEIGRGLRRGKAADADEPEAP